MATLMLVMVNIFANQLIASATLPQLHGSDLSWKAINEDVDETEADSPRASFPLQHRANWLEICHISSEITIIASRGWMNAVYLMTD